MYCCWNAEVFPDFTSSKMTGSIQTEIVKIAQIYACLPPDFLETVSLLNTFDLVPMIK